MRTDSRGLQVCCVVLTLVKVFADTRWPEPSTATTVLPGLTHLRECVSRRAASPLRRPRDLLPHVHRRRCLAQGYLGHASNAWNVHTVCEVLTLAAMACCYYRSAAPVATLGTQCHTERDNRGKIADDKRLVLLYVASTRSHTPPSPRTHANTACALQWAPLQSFDTVSYRSLASLHTICLRSNSNRNKHHELL